MAQENYGNFERIESHWWYILLCQKLPDGQNNKSESKQLFSNIVDINNGVPQGSVISVTLFLLAINDVTKHVQLPVNITIFADDIILFIKEKNINSSEKLMQNTLNSLEEHMKISGFQFSSQKTQTITFSNK